MTPPAAARGASGLAFAAAAYALVLACSFGGALENPYPAHDDCGWLVGLHRLADADVLGRLRACFDASALAIYYSPVRAAIWVLVHAVTGDRHWVFGMLVVQLVVHWASALAVVALVRRFGAGAAASFVAGLLFLVHPVSDQALTGVNGGINLFPMFFLLLAMLAWDRTGPHGPLRPWALGASALAHFASMNASPIFMVIGPLALSWAALVRQARQRSPWTAWLVRFVTRMLPHAAAFGASLGMRVLWFGTLTYEKGVFREGDLGAYLPDLWRHLVLLDANVSEVPFPSDVPALFAPGATHAILGGLAVAFGLLTAWAASRPGPARRHRDDAFALALAAGLFVIVVGAFFFVRGSPVKHRYLHLGLVGLGPTVALAASLVVAPLARRAPGAGRLAAVAALAVVLVPFARENARTVASAAYAMRACEATARAAAEVLRTDPAAARVVVVNLPQAVRRAGLVFNDEEGLRFQTYLEFAWAAGRRIESALAAIEPAMRATAPALHLEDHLLERWDEYAADAALRERTIVLFFDRDALRVERAAWVDNQRGPVAAGPLAFGPPVRPSYAPTGTWFARLETGRSVRVREEDARSLESAARWSATVRDKPFWIVANLGDLVARDYAQVPEILVEMLASPVRAVREAAAPHLGRLWHLGDPARIRSLVRSTDARRARAAVAVLGLRDDEEAVALLREAAEVEAVALDALAELARRKDAVARERLAGLARASDAQPPEAAVAALAWFGEDLDRAAALVVDDRAGAPARHEALHALLLAGHVQAPNLVRRALARAPWDDSRLAALVELADRLERETAALVLAAAFAHAPADSRVRDRCGVAWKRIVPEASIHEAKDVLGTLFDRGRPAPSDLDRTARFLRRARILPATAASLAAQHARGRPTSQAVATRAVADLPRDLAERARVEAEAAFLATPAAPKGRVRVEVSREHRRPGLDLGRTLQPFEVTVLNGTDQVLPGGPGTTTAALELGWVNRNPEDGRWEPTGPLTTWIEPLPRGILPGETATIVVGATLPKSAGWFGLACRVVLPGFELDNDLVVVPFSRREPLTTQPVVAIMFP